MESWNERLDHALKLRRVRKLHALAVELGVDESAVSRWRRSPAISLANAVNLCRTLDISLDWLLTGRGHILAHRSDATLTERFALEVFTDLPEARAAEAIEALILLARAVGPCSGRA
ncbi:MAG: transcriptional regulator [Alphaproteobacteria bacterium]|nr:MAG: transcriptional regulator [Alphaproteobacteria bacterium]PZO37471.1 MAG: transcriptional regulator [Alphaproteobacteria bacterium]